MTATSDAINGGAALAIFWPLPTLVHTAAELTSPQSGGLDGLRGVAQGFARIMDFNDDPAGARGEAGAGERHDDVAASGRMGGIHHHGESVGMRQHSDGGDVEDVAITTGARPTPESTPPTITSRFMASTRGCGLSTSKTSMTPSTARTRPAATRVDDDEIWNAT